MRIGRYENWERQLNNAHKIKIFDNPAIKSYKSAFSKKREIKFKRREYAYIKETHYKEPDCYPLC